jgi:hypothetical protein
LAVAAVKEIALALDMLAAEDFRGLDLDPFT